MTGGILGQPSLDHLFRQDRNLLLRVNTDVVADETLGAAFSRIWGSGGGGEEEDVHALTVCVETIFDELGEKRASLITPVVGAVEWPNSLQRAVEDEGRQVHQWWWHLTNTILTGAGYKRR